MKFLLVILLAGPGNDPVMMPVGTVDSEAACAAAGQTIVARTDAPADWFCLPLADDAAPQAGPTS